MKKRQIIALICVILFAVGIGMLIKQRTQESNTSDKLPVVASFYPLQYFTEQIGGDYATVANLTPPGAEPHDYELSPQQITQALDARLFVYNGANLEPWVEGILPDFTARPVQAADTIPLLKTGAASDPHFWLDPVLAQQIVENIKNGLIAADSLHASDYTKNAASLTSRLQQLDTDYKTALANCQRRTVVTSHQALAYLANRYNFEVLPIKGVDGEQEPSPEQIAQIVHTIKQTGAQYIFFEALASPRLAETIAHETGAQIIEFNPIEGLTADEQQQGEDYFTIQKQNIEQLKRALACS